MAEANSNIHGLAASIRACQESETFDLAGQNVESITKTMEEAFSEPLSHLVRLTFVTGAGKQSRQKYHAGAAKAVTCTLLELGYTLDRGASCVLECAGSFKTQHDTAKNQFTVVVIPRVETKEDDISEKQNVKPLIPKDSPGYMIAISSIPVFRNMVTSKCPSWSQKRASLECITALEQLLKELDDKLMNGIPLDASEQEFYDSVVSLQEKQDILKQQTQELVEHGQITALEQEELLDQNAERIASLEREHKATSKALQRKEYLTNIDPIEPRPLKHYQEIAKLYKELVPLLQLEKETRGQLLTVQQTQQLARKEEILEEMQHLEESSRGWLEDDAVFESRVQACRQQLERQHGSSATSTKKRQGKASTTSIDATTRAKNTKWVIPGSQGFGGTLGGKVKKNKGQGGKSLFGAMVMEDSSSSDDDDETSDDDDKDNLDETPIIPSSSDAVPVLSEMPKSTSGKKKSKRKKRKKAVQSNEIETTSTRVATTSTRDATLQDGITHVVASIVTGIINILQNYALPLLVGILSWLFSLIIFGKKKKQQ